MTTRKFADATSITELWAKVKSHVASAISGKVDKVDGKGLSTNDYTTAEKTKLDGIEENANNYSHPTYTAATAAAVKVGRDATGHVVVGNALAKADVGLGNVANIDQSKAIKSITRSGNTLTLTALDNTTSTVDLPETQIVWG